MHQLIKNILGVALILGIVMGVSAVGKYVRAYADSIEPSSFRSFSVSGEGEVIAIPDVAEFTVGITTEGEKNALKQAQLENTKQVNEIVSFLKSNGVKKEDVKTTRYAITPQYEYTPCRGGKSPCPPPRLVRYKIDQEVRVKARDLENAGTLLEGTVSRGANTVSGLTFSVDDPTVKQRDAREEAIKKAKVKAREIAAAAGFKLGKLLSISENGPIIFQKRTFSSAMSFGEGMGGAAPAPDFEPGSEELTVTVTLIYEIR